MRESKTTPGPWVAVEANESCPFPSGVAIAVHAAAEPWKKTGSICSMTAQGDGKYSPEVTTANAALIASAPALLLALERAKKAIADILDNCPYFFPDRGIAANLTPEQAAWRKKVQVANDAARAALAEASKGGGR